MLTAKTSAIAHLLVASTNLCHPAFGAFDKSKQKMTTDLVSGTSNPNKKMRKKASQAPESHKEPSVPITLLLSLNKLMSMKKLAVISIFNTGRNNPGPSNAIDNRCKANRARLFIHTGF